MLLSMAASVEAQPLIAVRDVRASSRGTGGCLRRIRCRITSTAIFMTGCSPQVVWFFNSTLGTRSIIQTLSTPTQPLRVTG